MESILSWSLLHLADHTTDVWALVLTRSDMVSIRIVVLVTSATFDTREVGLMNAWVLHYDM